MRYFHQVELYIFPATYLHTSPYKYWIYACTFKKLKNLGDQLTKFISADIIYHSLWHEIILYQ